jgi:hypothetical protein
MQTSLEQLAQWLAEPEGLRLEFKEAIICHRPKLILEFRSL